MQKDQLQMSQKQRDLIGIILMMAIATAFSIQLNVSQTEETVLGSTITFLNVMFHFQKRLEMENAMAPFSMSSVSTKDPIMFWSVAGMAEVSLQNE